MEMVLGIVDLCFAAMLIWIGYVDIKTMRIPNRLVLGIIGLGVLRRLLVCGGWGDALPGAVCVSVPMLLLTLAVPGSIGGGDIKLSGAVGLYMGVAGVVEGTLFGMLSAGAFGVVLLVTKRKTAREELPLGPFLAVGYLYVLNAA